MAKWLDAPSRECDPRPVSLVLRAELDHMARRERQRGLVRRRVRAVVPDRQVAHARHLEPCEGAGVARGARGGRGAVEVADAREDGVDRARLGADEIRVARLRV